MTTAAVHTCPGGCGRTVNPGWFACRQCWFRLPAGIRSDYATGQRRSRQKYNVAVAAAHAWYTTHPAPLASKVVTAS
jgi:hypothetical protein